MKRKIIFGLSIFALMFLFGGIYIIRVMEETFYDLHRLSQLHRTVAVRKDLLLSIEKNQYDIMIRSVNPAASVAQDDHGLRDNMNRCLACHHPVSSADRIARLSEQSERYRELIDAFFTVPARSAAAKRKTIEALKLGDDMIEKTERFISIMNNDFSRQEREILEKIDQNKTILFVLVTIGPFFAIGFAYILVRGLTRPVNSLLDATRRLKAGDMDHRIRGLQDEFGELAGSFNEMVASLKKQMKEMQRTEQLRVCGEMAAGLAHEIRNPLAGMKLSIEVLLAELDIEERDREVLVKVIEQIRHIELLMKNLLNYARPAAAQPVSVDVNQMLEKTVYFIERHPTFIAGGPHKQVIQDLDPDLPEIHADPQQLQQVFLNLLLNAADATVEGGDITVATRYDGAGKAVAVELRDTGKGIPAELMAKIFQPFFTTKGKGTGLGLAVSKRIVEEHGGSIEVAGQPSGGVVFTVILPVNPQDKGGTA